MKILLTLSFFLFTLHLSAQKNDDSKITITVNDSVGIYEKVKYSLVNSEFMIKDNGNKDTLTTYSLEYNGIHCIARAIINGNIVTLTGAYGLKRLNDWGYTQSPKNYNQIVYYKGSKGWKLLMQVANRLNGQITYSK